MVETGRVKMEKKEIGGRRSVGGRDVESIGLDIGIYALGQFLGLQVPCLVEFSFTSIPPKSRFWRSQWRAVFSPPNSKGLGDKFKNNPRTSGVH